MTVKLNSTSGFKNPYVLATNLPKFGRNLVINGDMAIHQRVTNPSTIASSTGTTLHGFAADRWNYQSAYTGASISLSQSTDVPVGQGFTNSISATNGGTATPVADTISGFTYRFRDVDLAPVGFGTADAKTTTISFWIKSSSSSVIVIEWFRFSNSTFPSTFRSIRFGFSVNQLNTWEKKSFTVPADTTGPACLFDNSQSAFLRFWLSGGSGFTSETPLAPYGSWHSDQLSRAAGVGNFFAVNANSINLTGVQVEIGSQPTAFEFLPHDYQLSRCQAYYNKTMSQTSAPANALDSSGALTVNAASSTTAGLVGVNWRFPVEMRAAPTVTTFTPVLSGSGGFRADTGVEIAATVFNAASTGVSITNNATTPASTTRLDIHAVANAEFVLA